MWWVCCCENSWKGIKSLQLLNGLPALVTGILWYHVLAQYHTISQLHVVTIGYFLNHHWIWWFFRMNNRLPIAAFQPPLGVHKIQIQRGPGLVQMSESHSASSSATASLVLFWCFGKGAKVEITSINMAQLIISYFRFVFWFIPWKLDLQCFRGVETSDQRRFHFHTWGCQTNGLTNWSSKDGNATN